MHIVSLAGRRYLSVLLIFQRVSIKSSIVEQLLTTDEFIDLSVVLNILK